MGMSLDATIVFGVPLPEDNEFINELLDSHEYEIEDAWAAIQAGLTAEEWWELEYEDRCKYRTHFPSPLLMEYAGTDTYTIRILYAPGTRISAYYDPLEFSPSDLVEPEGSDFRTALQRLGITQEPKWVLFPTWI